MESITEELQKNEILVTELNEKNKEITASVFSLYLIGFNNIDISIIEIYCTILNTL